MKRANHRPSTPGAILALGAGAVAVALLVDGVQWRPLLVECAGFVLLGAGVVLARRRSRAVGTVVALSGVALVGTGILLALFAPLELVERIELVPGMVGLAVLCLGVLPLRKGRERALVTAGTGLVFVGVVVNGVVLGASLVELLLATVATVLSWDAADQAVSLGRQVGRQARTARAELTHAGGTLAVGGVVIAATLGIERLDVTGLSLAAMALLIGAGFVLALSLRQ